MVRNRLVYAWWRSGDLWCRSDVESDHEIAMDVLERLPESFREIRLMYGLSIDDVVEQVGVSRPALFRFERGREPKLSTILCVLRWIMEMSRPSTDV